jgi:hypothetical protein
MLIVSVKVQVNRAAHEIYSAKHYNNPESTDLFTIGSKKMKSIIN